MYTTLTRLVFQLIIKQCAMSAGCNWFISCCKEAHTVMNALSQYHMLHNISSFQAFCHVTLERQNWGVFLFFEWTSIGHICSRGAFERLRSSICLWLYPQWKSTYKRYQAIRDVCLTTLEANKIDLPRVYWRNVLSICPRNPPKACIMLQQQIIFQYYTWACTKMGNEIYPENWLELSWETCQTKTLTSRI